MSKVAGTVLILKGTVVKIDKVGDVLFAPDGTWANVTYTNGREVQVDGVESVAVLRAVLTARAPDPWAEYDGWVWEPTRRALDGSADDEMIDIDPTKPLPQMDDIPF